MTRTLLLALLAVLVLVIAVGLAVAIYQWLIRRQVPAPPHTPELTSADARVAQVRMVQDWLRAQVFEQTGQETSTPAMQTLLWQAAQRALADLQTRPEAVIVIPEITTNGVAFQAHLSAAVFRELQRYTNPSVDIDPSG